MKVFVTYRCSVTYGQTGAGCHAYAGAGEVIDSCAVDAEESEIVRFMEEHQPVMHSPEGGRGFFLEGIEGFKTLVKILLDRKNAPEEKRHMLKYRHYKFQIGDSPVLAGESRLIDGANSAYQKALLKGEA